MRRILGVAVLVGGVLGLGLWGSNSHAPRIQAAVDAGASKALEGSTHGVTASVSGRDIHVTGLADTAGERDRLMAALDAVPGRRVVDGTLILLPVASPYETRVGKAAAGVLSAMGHIPSEKARAALEQLSGEARASLVLASGAPEGHLDLLKAGIAALEPMNSGKAVVRDGKLRVSGEVLGPDEKAAVEMALAGLPDDAVGLNVTMLDDGSPPDWTISYDVGQGAHLQGKLPKGLAPQAVAEALGFTVIGNDATAALLGKPETEVPAVLSALKPWLPELEMLTVRFGPDGSKIEAQAGQGSDVELLREMLGTSVGSAYDINVIRRVPGQPEGAERVNVVTGERERLMGGFWLPVVEFDAAPESCTQQAEAALTMARVNFVSGSDRLDARAMRALNRLAAAMAPCAAAGFRAEIGGHTDSTGDPLANLGLSQRRAVAVRLALIARGLPPAALRAQGYGAEQPVADNATEEGRALNRRTTIIWSQ